MRTHTTDETEGATPFFLVLHFLKEKIERDFAPIIIIPWLLFVAPLASQP
jgi:hypothetical protein